MTKTRERKQYLIWVEELKTPIETTKKQIIELIAKNKIRKCNYTNTRNNYYEPIKK